ncbi:hypothetical protein Hanom_Chr14g01302281 [Helianthus anomalus]
MYFLCIMLLIMVFFFFFFFFLYFPGYLDIAEDFFFIKPFYLLNMNVEELKQTIEKNRVLQAAMNLQSLRKGKEREDSEIVGKGKQKIDDDVNYKLNESVAFGGTFLEFLRCD